MLNPLWQRAGRRWLAPRLSLVPALEDPLQRWWQVYRDFGASPQRDSALRHALLAVCGPLGLGGMLLTPIDHGLYLFAMRVRRPFRGLGVGTFMVQRATAIAAARHLPVWLAVLRNDVPAMRLHADAGFEVIEPESAGASSTPPPTASPNHLIMCYRPGCAPTGADRVLAERQAGANCAQLPATSKRNMLLARMIRYLARTGPE